MMKHNTSSYYNTDSEKSQAVFLRKYGCSAAASSAVKAEGDALTAEGVSSLQAQYGFMIAPALRDLGKLGLMQIPADAPCTDAEQLAAFADYFKA